MATKKSAKKHEVRKPAIKPAITPTKTKTAKGSKGAMVKRAAIEKMAAAKKSVSGTKAAKRTAPKKKIIKTKAKSKPKVIRPLKTDELPINEFGNVELTRATPEGCLHLPSSEYPRIGPTCKRLSIPYAKALVGFEREKYPLLDGVVILKKDWPAVENALAVKAERRARQAANVSVLSAMFTLNRRAKRCRDQAQTFYREQMHGLARNAREEKELLYNLKGQALHYLLLDGQLTGGEYQRIRQNWAEVLTGDGYRFHRPCSPPLPLPQNPLQIGEIDSKPKGSQRADNRNRTDGRVRGYLRDKPHVAVFQWPSRRRLEPWEYDANEDVAGGVGKDDFDDYDDDDFNGDK